MDLGCCPVTAEYEIKIQYWRQYQGRMLGLSEMATDVRQFLSMRKDGSSSLNRKLKSSMKTQKSTKMVLMVRPLALCSLMTKAC